MAEAVAEEDEEEAPQGGARSRIVEAFWSGTFLLIAGPPSCERKVPILVCFVWFCSLFQFYKLEFCLILQT